MPNVFVGSSSEARESAELIGTLLRDVAYVTPWWDAPEFGSLNGIFEALLKTLQQYQFAIFFLTPDDVIGSRGIKGYSTRDNVLFEAGLFIGAIGRDRVEFLVQEGTPPVLLPSDLDGVVMPRFKNGAAEETIRTALSNIRKRIRALGKIKQPWKLLRGYGFDPDTRKFHMTLSDKLLQNSAKRIEGKAFLLVVLKEDLNNDVNKNVNIAISAIRKPTAGDNLIIAVALPPKISITQGDCIEAHLLCVPEALKLGRYKTLGKLLKAGAEPVVKRRYLIPA